MNLTNPKPLDNKTFNERLDNLQLKYKLSLSDWVARADNDTPPNNQKGRIFIEIDAEFKASLIALVDEVTEAKVQLAKWEGAIDAVETYLEALKKNRES